MWQGEVREEGGSITSEECSGSEGGLATDRGVGEADSSAGIGEVRSDTFGLCSPLAICPTEEPMVAILASSPV